MQFIQELEEARMTRNEQNVKVLTYADCCERLYLTLLILQTLSNFPSASASLRSYCKNSNSDRYKHFKISGTDLRNFIYFVRGDEFALGKLKNPGAARQARANTNLPIENIKSYLTALSLGNQPMNAQQMFIRLENILNINNSDYKRIRRDIFNYNRLDISTKKTIVTKLIYAARAKLRSSDIIDDFERFVSIKGLESEWVPDNEPTISKPDLSSASADYVYYRYLVGTQNLALVKAFLDLAAEGKPIPSNMVKAYAPAIKALDDIVRGGPSYISMFRTIQNRAKNSLKR